MKNKVLFLLTFVSCAHANDSQPMDKNIFQAAQAGDLDAVKKLVEQDGVSVNTIGNNRTPIMYAIGSRSSDNQSVVKYLIDQGADVNFLGADDFAVTPLMAAVSNKQTNLVTLLLKYGADINARDHRGFTAITYAVGNPSMVQLLISKAPQFKNDPMVIDAAIAKPDDKSLELLLSHGAKPITKLKDGQSVIDYINARIQQWTQLKGKKGYNQKHVNETVRKFNNIKKILARYGVTQ